MPLQWSRIDVPGINGNVVVSPSEVSEIAIGSGIFYALDTANSKVYRSRNNGLRWEDISKYLSQAGATLPATKIAIAPDAPAILAVVTDIGTKVFLSIDGGITWVNANVPSITGTIQAIAISEQYTEGDYTCRDIAIGTATWGDGLTTGQVWLLTLGIPFPPWRDLELTLGAGPGADVSAVAFSPNYDNDRTIAVVASTNAETYLCLYEPEAWNLAPGYPVKITDEGDDVGISQIIVGLALPSNFLNPTGVPSTQRKALVSFDRQPISSERNVYRIDDTILVSSNLSGISISSISLSGSKLLAGEANPEPPDFLTVPVHVTSNVFDPSSLTLLPATQPPSGPGNAKVAWGSGNTAYCGTGQIPGGSSDESAFSVSEDGGDTWMQISLIDTELTILDIALAPSPASLFMTTTSPVNIESVWRSAGEPLGKYWGRVLVMDASSNKVILRLSPNYRDDYTLYVAEVDNPPNTNSRLIWVTNDRGNTWRERHIPWEVVDMAVADKNTVYAALSNGTVSKSVNGAKSWQYWVSTCLPQINMLYLVDGETLLVGGKGGDVAYSTDGGKSFSHTPLIGTDDDVQVVSDTNWGQGGIIYAGSGNGIYRRAVGTDIDWEVMETINADRKISGIVLADEVLYAAWFDTANGSGAERCLEPAVSIFSLEWDTLQTGSETSRFDATPTSLRFITTATENNLWVIDTLNSTLMVYSDCLAKRGPTISGPELVGCDPVSGRNQEINLTWEQLCLAKKYDILIAKDLDFTLRVYENQGYEPFSLTSPALVIPAGNDSFECGHTYYWKARVSGSALEPAIRSPWSETKSFQTKTGLPVTTTAYGIQALSPMNGNMAVSIKGASFSWSGYKDTTEYQFQLAEDATMSKLLADTRTVTTAYSYDKELSYSKSYYWRVRATEPAESDWSSVFSFMTEEESPPQPTEQPPAQTTETLIPPYLLWSMLSVGFLLAICLIVLIVRTKR